MTKSPRRETAKSLFATLVGTMDNNALIPIIAFYAISLGADLFMAGLIVGAYSIVHVPANLVFGRGADRIGRKRPHVYGLLWDSISLALYAVAASPIGLLLVRLSHGLGGGFVGPAAVPLVRKRAAPGRPGRSLALYGISIAIAVIVGFAFAGIASARGAYTTLFFGISAALWIGAVVASRISERVERRRAAPPLDRRAFLAFLRSRRPIAGFAALFALYFVLGALVTIAPDFRGTPIELTDTRFAIALTAFALVSVAVHYPSGVLSDRIGPALPSALGLAATPAAGVAALPRAPSYGVFVGLMVLFGLGHGLVFPSSSSFVSRSARSDFLGLASGVYYALLVAGVAVCAPLSGALAVATSGEIALLVSALVALAALVIVLPAYRGSEPLRSKE